VHSPGDFVYLGELGSGAFGKVRKCQLKSSKSTDDQLMEDSSTSSNSSMSPSAEKFLEQEYLAVKLQSKY
jgi:hypothetical protein